jgi:hypothetical protein
MEADSLLITKADLQKIRPTALLDNDRVEPFIRDAQKFDLKPELNDVLFLDLLKKFDKTDDASYAKYQDLLDGKEYTKDEQTIRFGGIREILCYYTFARFLPEHPMHITRFGLTMKIVDQSAPTQGGDIKRVVDILKSNASTLVRDMRTFLDDNAADYPLWRAASPSTVKKTGFQFFKG